MKIIFNANDILEAHIVAGMLRAYGIEPYVGGHYLQGAVGDLAAAGFANIQVSDDDEEAALSVIQQYQQPAFDGIADDDATTGLVADPR